LTDLIIPTQMNSSPLTVQVLRRKLAKNLLRAHHSYAQCGEDLLIAFLFRTLGIERPSYLDIGAHDPSYLNNTKLLYERGSHGINIEANPRLLQRFRRERPDDVNLNIGVADDASDGRTLDFFVMSTDTLSTFSGEEARRLERDTRTKIEQVLKIPVRGVLSVVQEHADGKFPDLLCVDIEGLDEVVLPSVAACEGTKRPKVICIETLVYEENKPPRKKTELIDQIAKLGYQVYADTHINTIFCREDLRVFV
jgi:FkbM family methyltransferase